NMILMGDGRSNILHQDSLNGYDGNYLYSHPEKPFPATAFVLNPPYSALGNGMCFVERALSKMSHGYAAIIIQNSAGSGNAASYNKQILKHSSLLASIKMPLDLFSGRSSVQTNIYVFQVGKAHRKDDVVKFIDFSYDGYKRGNRKKAKNQDVNLRDDGTAKKRYEELVRIVNGNGTPKLQYLREQDYYEGYIDPENGTDWNQSAPIEIVPTLNDFRRTVADYLAWKVSDLIKNQPEKVDGLGKL
ncbi:MAG: N-6 DNA methylase, partial [Bacteroidaceae bacterium]|nr:N-6 DNA methylase [Bacteroidaceae bacterium]